MAIGKADVTLVAVTQVKTLTAVAVKDIDLSPADSRTAVVNGIGNQREERTVADAGQTGKAAAGGRTAAGGECIGGFFGKLFARITGSRYKADSAVGVAETLVNSNTPL